MQLFQSSMRNFDIESPFQRVKLSFQICSKKAPKGERVHFTHYASPPPRHAFLAYLFKAWYENKGLFLKHRLSPSLLSFQPNNKKTNERNNIFRHWRIFHKQTKQRIRSNAFVSILDVHYKWATIKFKCQERILICHYLYLLWKFCFGVCHW